MLQVRRQTDLCPRFIAAPLSQRLALTTCCVTRIRLAQLSPCALPPNPLQREARRQVISRSYALSRDMKRFLSGWFKFCRFEDIYVENALEWLAWSLFGDFIDRVPPSEQDELAGYIKDFENYVGQPLQPGYNTALRNGCIRINLDPVSARHRPLVSYAVTYAPMYCQIIMRTTAACPIKLGSPN